MTAELAEIARALMALAPSERAVVIESALVSLDDDGTPQDELDAAWHDTVDRRLDDVENGRVRLVGAEESEARVRELLAELHR